MLMQRLSGRMMCPKCGKSYHKINLKPKIEGKCDLDNGNLYQREDDKSDNILIRLKAYGDVTEPLVEYYKNKNELIIINGELPLEKIVEETLKHS